MVVEPVEAVAVDGHERVTVLRPDEALANLDSGKRADNRRQVSIVIAV